MDIPKHLIRQLQRDRAEFVVIEKLLRAEAVKCHRAVSHIDHCLARVTR